MTKILKSFRHLFNPILYLLSLLWAFVHYLRINNGRHEKMPIPVVCVGNFTMGGAGKTPTVIFLAKYLKKNKIKVHVVSRGYKGNFKGVTLVDPDFHDALVVGDEPLLISKYVKVWVSRDKKKGILEAYRAGAELVLLDDGYQNFSIAKDLNILVIDTDLNLKNEKIFPLGNLRERPSLALSRADFVICIGSSVSRRNILKTQISTLASKTIEGKFKPELSQDLKKRELIAFCGIGRPEKFFSMLKKFNLKLIDQHSFPDHHFYSPRQLKRLINISKKSNALLATTSKDYVRIPIEFKHEIIPINIDLILSKDENFLSQLKSLVF